MGGYHPKDIPGGSLQLVVLSQPRLGRLGSGRRLDHVWATPDIANAGQQPRLRPVRGWEKPSDHVPVLASFDL